MKIKQIINQKLEKICISVVSNTLYKKDYKKPWWFKIVSELEFWTRAKP